MSLKSPYSLPTHLAGTEPKGLQTGEPVAQFQIGDYRNFVYLIVDWGSRKAAVVDPQEDISPLLEALTHHGLLLTDILLTHTHFDHIPGVPELVELFPEIPVRVHRLDAHRLQPQGPSVSSRIQETEEGQIIPLGSIEIRALHSPGHSAGELCYHFQAPSQNGTRRPYLLSGDTLFIRDCGRTDLESGSNAEMFATLQKIKALPAATIILPGHHYVKECASILAQEIQESPPLRCRSVSELEALP